MSRDFTGTVHRLVSTLLFLFLAGCGAADVTVLSTRTSPDGILVAENLLTGDEGNGRLLIRGKDGSEHHFDFTHGLADLFLRWSDDRNLEVWTEEPQPEFINSFRLGDVWVIPKVYGGHSHKWLESTSSENDSRKDMIMVHADKVVSAFSSSTNGTLRLCVLKIGAAESPNQTAADVELTVHVNSGCNRRRPCGAIDSRFTLDERPNVDHQTTLTSATISAIPSYNRIPTGDRGISLRGEFLEESAASLLDRLNGASITLDFVRDFSGPEIRYNLPISSLKSSLDTFRTCVGDADMLWLRH
ncbi:hypothetical protein [Xanthobacter sp.]|uniref:hypothetical protein n=1 Tax=Xanthobacter sp. TaxID=35809 RepID=UPI0025E66CB8|nr:hypothetical protein [Xanthobacter sp.]